ncbi:DUF3196 family protein [Mycoplasmoides alvi]|uniref:DUF3196 family protein n=1 Tax=Mycoplasmoides alvi TaxID=78580 RepID=UPI00051B26DB|nr:DUF3196 family protein [Mycoplasmoides alvi]
MKKNANNFFDSFLNIKELVNFFSQNENLNSIVNYNFYLKIINNSYKEFEKKNYEKAIELLLEELEAPYIPDKVEKYYNMMIKLIRQETYEKRNNKIENLDSKSLIKLALENFPKNIHIFDYFTTKPIGYFAKEDIDYFRFIFTSKEFKNDLKLNILYLISEILDFVNSKIVFFNHNINDSSEIILGHNLFSNDVLNYYNEVEKEISNLLFQEPSLEDMALSIVEQIANFYFPKFPNKINSIELGKTIVYYVSNLFYPNKFKELINKNQHIFDFILHVINTE